MHLEYLSNVYCRFFFIVGFVPDVPTAMEEQMYAEEDARGSKVETFVLIVMIIVSWLISRDNDDPTPNYILVL